MVFRIGRCVRIGRRRRKQRGLQKAATSASCECSELKLPTAKSSSTSSSSETKTASARCTAVDDAQPAESSIPKSTTGRPVLVRTMTSGTLDDCEMIHLDSTATCQQSPVPHVLIQMGSSSSIAATANNSTRKPGKVHNPSYCESLDETSVASSSVYSLDCPDNNMEVRKLPSMITNTSSIDVDPVQEIFSTLNEQEKETAARTSWKYYCEVGSQTGKTDIPRRDALARAMIQRHLAGEDGDVDTACHKLHATLKGRQEENIDWIRTAWQENDDDDDDDDDDQQHSNNRTSSLTIDTNVATTAATTTKSQEQIEFSRTVRSKMRRWLGPHGRVCVLDYDDEGRCNFYHRLAISTQNTRYDREAILYAASYMMEKAIACTERRSNGQQSRVNVVLDYRGADIRNRDQTLPISIALEVVELMRDHHPDRLWTITMIDAPLLARFAWPIFRPFVHQIVKGGVTFVTGKKQILKAFGPKMYYYDRASNLDMDKFFQLPFDQTYEDVHGHALEY